MRQIVLAALLSLLAWPALAQLPGGSELQIDRTPVIGGSTPNCLYITSTNKVGQQACGAGTAADVTVGTTTITGGTASGVLWKNSGVLAAGPTTTDGTGNIAIPSAATIAWNADTIIGRSAAAAFRHGAADAAVPVAQTMGVQNVVGGTNNTAGAVWTFQGSRSTGDQTGGSILFQTSQAGSSGTSQNPLTTILTIAGNGNVTVANSLSVGTAGILRFGNRGSISSPADSILLLRDFASSNFDRLQFGGTTASFPSLQRSGAGLIFQLADNSANTSFTATTATWSNVASDAATTTATLCRDTSSGLMRLGSGTLGICLGTSSARFKHDIIDEVGGVERISALRPVSYKYNGGNERALYGFVAEEVAVAMPELVSRDMDGKPNSVDMLGMIPFLVNSIKELRAEIVELRQK